MYYNIKKFRRERGISQEELAKNIGVSRSTIAKYEKGERNPPISTLQKISDYLKVPINEFGVNIPEGYRIVDPFEFFENMPLVKDIFCNSDKQRSKSSILDFHEEKEDLDLEAKNKLIDAIIILFNQNNIYLSFEELEILEKEVREYILFKAYLINNNKE